MLRIGGGTGVTGLYSVAIYAWKALKSAMVGLDVPAINFCPCSDSRASITGMILSQYSENQIAPPAYVAVPPERTGMIYELKLG